MTGEMFRLSTDELERLKQFKQTYRVCRDFTYSKPFRLLNLGEMCENGDRKIMANGLSSECIGGYQIRFPYTVRIRVQEEL